MYPIAEQFSWNPILPAAMLAVSACLAVWGWVLARWWQRRPVAPYQPRRPAPWHAFELAIVVLFYLAMQSAVIGLGSVVLGSEAMRPPASYNSNEPNTQHIVGRLVAEGDAWVLLLCGVSAVLLAPVTEEFFFRVLLQGWLQALQRRWRREMPTLRWLVPNGIGPIVLTSLLFARMHFRVDAPQPSVRFVIFLLLGDAVARLLTLGFAVGFLRWRVGATAADLGWAPWRLSRDIGLGLAAFAAVAVPIYAMQIALRLLLPESIAPDPLPLFFLALALGTLYYRTHRIMPLIVLHAALNGTSLALAWLGG